MKKVYVYLSTIMLITPALVLSVDVIKDSLRNRVAAMEDEVKSLQDQIGLLDVPPDGAWLQALLDDAKLTLGELSIVQGMETDDARVTPIVDSHLRQIEVVIGKIKALLRMGEPSERTVPELWKELSVLEIQHKNAQTAQEKDAVNEKQLPILQELMRRGEMQ